MTAADSHASTGAPQQPSDWLSAAFEEARLGRSEGGIPVGSVLVHQGRVLARGRNRRVQYGSVIRHAELDTLENAGRQTAAAYSQATLVTTLAPCPMCIGAILLYGIGHVVIGDNATFRGDLDRLRAAGVAVEIVDDGRCRELLAEFIAAEPALWLEDGGEQSPS